MTRSVTVPADPWPVDDGLPGGAGKRWADRLLAGILLVLCSPVIGAAILLVKMTSRGPGIYSQSRLGLGHRAFTLYKIRTMAHDCEARTGPRWAARNDPRVTRVGKFLRTTHVDELPQLWNVLRGEMALVGPRPERPEIVSRLVPIIPGYHRRLDVLPGVTGLAQVQLPPDVSPECVRRKLQYDLYYIRHAGPWLDVRLMIATAVKVFGTVGVALTVLRIPGRNEVESFGPLHPSAEPSREAVLPRVGAARPELSGA
jgi:lipopolysaccharide/colanic/teichoic acid biosynthesis glycosyltransferase